MSTFSWTGEVAKQMFRASAARGIQDALTLVENASNEIVPRETGNLAGASGTDVDAENLRGSVYYDDARDVKTIKQHEDLSYKHPPGESAKFLEKALRAQNSAALDVIANSVRKGLT